MLGHEEKRRDVEDFIENSALDFWRLFGMILNLVRLGHIKEIATWINLKLVQNKKLD